MRTARRLDGATARSRSRVIEELFPNKPLREAPAHLNEDQLWARCSSHRKSAMMNHHNETCADKFGTIDRRRSRVGGSRRLRLSPPWNGDAISSRTATKGTARRSAASVNRCETFLARRIGEALVERDNSQRCGTAFRGCEAARAVMHRPPERANARNRTALSRTISLGSISCQPSKRFSRSHASAILPAERGRGPGAPERENIYFRSPRRQHVGIPPASACTAGVVVPRPAAARSLKNPKISPRLPASSSEGVERRSPARAGGGSAAEERPRRRGPARPHEPVTDEPRQPSVLPSFMVPGHGFQPRDGTP